MYLVCTFLFRQYLKLHEQRDWGLVEGRRGALEMRVSLVPTQPSSLEKGQAPFSLQSKPSSTLSGACKHNDPV